MSPSVNSKPRLTAGPICFEMTIIVSPKAMPKTTPKPVRTKKIVSTITMAPMKPFTQFVFTLSERAAENIAAPQRRLPRYPALSVTKALPPKQ